MSEPLELLTPAEAAEILKLADPAGAGRRLVVKLFRTGRVEAYRLSERTWRCSREALEAYLRRVSTAAPRPRREARGRARR